MPGTCPEPSANLAIKHLDYILPKLFVADHLRFVAGSPKSNYHAYEPDSQRIVKIRIGCRCIPPAWQQCRMLDSELDKIVVIIAHDLHPGQAKAPRLEDQGYCDSSQGYARYHSRDGTISLPDVAKPAPVETLDRPN